MKKKLKIVSHGTQWIDPNPAPVIICPECGGYCTLHHGYSYFSANHICIA